MFLMPSSQDRVQTETRNPTTSFTPPVFLIMLPLMLFFLIFDLFCTYWAVLGLFASLLAWMDPFILWPHSLTELFSEKALQLTAPFSFFPPLFLGESIIMRSKVLTVLQCTRIPKGKSFPMQGPWRLPTIESKLKSRFCVALLAIPVKLRFYFLKLKRRGGEKKSHQIFLRVEWRKKKKNQLTGKHSRSSTIHVQCSITVNDNQEEVRHSKTKTDHNEQPNKSSFLSLSTQFGLNLDLICQTLL